MIKTVSIILLFIIKCLHRLKLKRNDSLFITIKKYGASVLLLYRQLEKVRVRQCRVERAVEFLRVCLIYNVYPKFIRFKPYNKSFGKSGRYKEYLRRMVFDEYKLQQKELNKLTQTMLDITDQLKN